MILSSKQEIEQSGWLRDIFLHSPDVIVLLNNQGFIQTANESFLRFLNHSSKSLQGKHITAFVPPENHAQWEHDLAKLIKREWTIMDGALLNGSGRTVPFHITLIANSSYNGQPAVILHFQDASAHQNVERALIASQSQWELSFDAITDYMCLLDHAGNILRANRSMLARFQPLYGKLTGLDYRKLFSGAPNNHFQSPTLPDAITQSPYVIGEIEFANPKGWFNISAYPIKDDELNTTGAILIARDITEQYRTAEALRKIEAIQHQTSKMEAIGRLAGGIAHDFNNMLTAILGYGSLVRKMTTPDDPRQKDIQEIIQAAERATALTRQLLNFSRNQEIETTIINLNTIIKNTKHFLTRTLGENIQLIMRLDRHLANIKADVSRLEQIIINLAINARDAMPQGGKLIIETVNTTLDPQFCRTHPELKAGAYVLLEISDTGCGMSPQVQEHIFEPFFTTKPKGKGTGLGLTTTYGIIRQFNGHISCYSETGKGTTFKIYLPKCREHDIPDEAINPLETDLLRGNETILIADDERNIVSMVSQILSELGYEVLAATNAQEALRLSEQHPGKIDMLLTDIIMPEINGAELLRRLRAKRPDLKALFMSGYASNAASQIGALETKSAFLQKPFNADNLTHAIRSVLTVPNK